ncbi:T9SS type B sorting domain-containing protein [Flavobacterium sp.]|uniref:T9SS type B sorting domain-containing protein n=1 Tax=Flavobacterium sp. TaxID=239 RepID=UPI00261AA6B6|nr:choice-of-anchor L domain-containing protein [Flavobacterium sp.]
MDIQKRPYFFWLLMAFAFNGNAQYIQIDENRTPQQLVKDVLIDNPCADVSNIAVSGWSQNSGGTYGYFTAGTSAFPFADGIILSTGLVASAPGPNNSILSEGPTSWLGDDDLEQALGVNNSINATVLEFDFLPLANKFSFEYMFSSEQYLSNPSSNQCNYTDGFVFLLKEANSANPYQNLAVVPGTSIPVKVNTVRGPGTVCPAANEQFFGGFNGAEHPTNFNGQTVILKAESSVTPNVWYHIKLVVADQGNNLYDSAIFLGGGSFKVQKDLGIDRLLSTNNPVCTNETVVLDATEPGNNGYQWFRNNIPIFGATNPQFQPLQEGHYSVEITLNSTACKSTGEITLEFAAPLDNSPVNIVQCDDNNDGMAVFNLYKANDRILANSPGVLFQAYYEDASGTNIITTPDNFNSVPTTVYVKIANEYECTTIVPISLQIANNSLPAAPSAVACDSDNDGLYPFTLSTDITPQITVGLPSGISVNYYLTPQYAALEQNQLPDTFTTTEAFQQQIWAALTNGPDCYGLIPVTLTVNVFSGVGLDNENLFLCEGSAIPLEAPMGFSSYKWNNAAQSATRIISVDQSGTYTVTVTDANGCEGSKTFIVTDSGEATINAIDIIDFQGDRNTVQVNVSGAGSYEFSLDGQQYIDNSIFTDVVSGAYTVYIRDRNGCGIVTKPILVMDYPKFFTPNNDGINDIWQIPFLRLYPSAQVVIFDRYGKVVYGFGGSGNGWDGTLNSNPLPSTDYWFTISIDDRIIRGHFALKR